MLSAAAEATKSELVKRPTLSEAAAVQRDADTPLQ
jgi:hypothetical protein